MFDFEELEYHYLVANRTEDVTSTSKDDDDDDDDDEIKEGKDEKNVDDAQTSPGGAGGSNRSPIIDNPFLKAAKVPKRIKPEASVSLNFN